MSEKYPFEPCPLCGSVDWQDWENSHSQGENIFPSNPSIRCKMCGLVLYGDVGFSGDTPEAADKRLIERWNKRPWGRRQIMTKGDYIRSLPDKELAELLGDNMNCPTCPAFKDCHHEVCKISLLEWLKLEVKAAAET